MRVPDLALPNADAMRALDLRALVETHVAFVFRSLRRLGVPDMSLEDAVQQVWIVAARKLADIRPASERAFLFGVAVRVAADSRRSARRTRLVADDASLSNAKDDAPLADEHVDRKRARALLDDILSEMTNDLRAVFVLYELEEATMAEISEALAIPPGTVASRLRRARDLFQAELRRRMGGIR